MKVAVFGKNFNPEFHPFIIEFFNRLKERKAQVFLFRPLYDFLTDNSICNPLYSECFEVGASLPSDIDILISIGGDGTFLESIHFLPDFSVPVIGLNSGRLGFLANISKEEISEALDAIFSGRYELEERSLLQLRMENNPFGKIDYALNDITILKNDSYLISIKAYLNNEFLNNYWTDGLIISSPTGSTAYSLSVGGPILAPGSDNFVIAPIASHNLSVRPIVISDRNEIRIEVNSRSGNFLLTADNRSVMLESAGSEIVIGRSPHKLHMIKLPFNNFYATLRNKLMWGADKRN